MLDELDPTTPGARFPWAATAFACACVAAAVWTFMRFSYAWPVSLQDLDVDATAPGSQWLRARYVTFTGTALPKRVGRFWVWLPELPMDGTNEVTAVACTGPLPGQGEGPRRRFRGRADIEERWWNSLGSRVSYRIVVDCAASRWTGASVAGLVVGAMGILIFTLHLRR